MSYETVKERITVFGLLPACLFAVVLMHLLEVKPTVQVIALAIIVFVAAESNHRLLDDRIKRTNRNTTPVLGELRKSKDIALSLTLHIVSVFAVSTILALILLHIYHF